METHYAYESSELLKFNAYRRIEHDLDSAMARIEGKKLALGEPSCVVFYHPDADDPERETRMLVGTGGLDGSTYYTILQNPPFDGSTSPGPGPIQITHDVAYLLCESEPDAGVKTIDVIGYTLDTHVFLIIKMENKNTFTEPKMNIGDTGAISIVYNGKPVDENNTWDDGEVVDVYYDGDVYRMTTHEYQEQRDDLITSTIELTWAELKSLRDNSLLMPGQTYRIIDYECTTTQENTRSAGHQFDIIVTALTNNMLDPEAKAARHDFDSVRAEHQPKEAETPGNGGGESEPSENNGTESENQPRTRGIVKNSDSERARAIDRSSIREKISESIAEIMHSSPKARLLKGTKLNPVKDPRLEPNLSNNEEPEENETETGEKANCILMLSYDMADDSEEGLTDIYIPITREELDELLEENGGSGGRSLKKDGEEKDDGYRYMKKEEKKEKKEEEPAQDPEPAPTPEEKEDLSIIAIDENVDLKNDDSKTILDNSFPVDKESGKVKDDKPISDDPDIKNENAKGYEILTNVNRTMYLSVNISSPKSGIVPIYYEDLKYTAMTLEDVHSSGFSDKIEEQIEEVIKKGSFQLLKLGQTIPMTELQYLVARTEFYYADVDSMSEIEYDKYKEIFTKELSLLLIDTANDKVTVVTLGEYFNKMGYESIKIVFRFEDVKCTITRYITLDYTYNGFHYNTEYRVLTDDEVASLVSSGTFILRAPKVVDKTKEFTFCVTDSNELPSGDFKYLINYKSLKASDISEFDNPEVCLKLFTELRKTTLAQSGYIIDFEDKNCIFSNLIKSNVINYNYLRVEDRKILYREKLTMSLIWRYNGADYQVNATWEMMTADEMAELYPDFIYDSDLWNIWRMSEGTVSPVVRKPMTKSRSVEEEENEEDETPEQTLLEQLKFLFSSVESEMDDVTEILTEFGICDPTSEDPEDAPSDDNTFDNRRSADNGLVTITEASVDGSELPDERTYFDGCRLEDWKLWYSLDNDTERFLWADNGTYIPGAITSLTIKYTTLWGDQYITYDSSDLEYHEEDGEFYAHYSLYWASGAMTVYISDDPSRNNEVYDDETPFMKDFEGNPNVVGTITEYQTEGGTYIEPGKGVIYRMIDEYGNDCPYDFKNIQYSGGELSDYFPWMFTFDYHMYNSETDEFDAYDATIIGNLSLVDDEQAIDGVTNNVIKNSYNDAYYDDDDNYVPRRQMMLPQDIFLEYSDFYGYNNNFMDVGSYGNMIMSGCNNNRMGIDAWSNYLGNMCTDNVFKNGNYSNSLDEDCWSNVFDDGCYRNDFDSVCYWNVLGGDCHDNTFTDSCQRNRFGIGCYRNTIRSCNDNIFGNNCYRNTLEGSCSNNIFGNNCYRNTLQGSCINNNFGKVCSANTFGTDCYNNILGDDCSDVTFGRECGDNILGDTCSYVTFGNRCVGNTVAGYCSDINFGSECIYNRINKSTEYITLAAFNEYWEINMVNSFTNNNQYYRFCKVEDTDYPIVVSQSVTTSDSNYVQNIVIDQYENPIVTEVRQTYRTYFKLGSDRIIYPDLNN